jgi:hypothetical protein
MAELLELRVQFPKTKNLFALSSVLFFVPLPHFYPEATATGIGPGTTAMYMQRATSGAAGNGLYTTITYMRGAAGIGPGTTIKHLPRATSGAAGNGLGATIKYLRRTTSAAAKNCLSTAITPPCSAASFEVNSEPKRTGCDYGKWRWSINIP